MRKSMLVKKFFFINTGISITVKTNNGPTLVEEFNAHISLPLQISQFSWHIEEISVSHFYILPSDPNKLNLNSSLKWTIFHCSSVQTICSVAKSRGTFWFSFEIKGLRRGIRANNFSLFNQRETVFLEIHFSVCSRNSREIDVAVLKRSFKDILTTIWCSRLVVIGGLPVLGFGSSVLLALNLLITR